MTHYLFAYFTSDKSGDENVQYAVSTDGLNYQPLNGGRPVILGDTTALSGGLRDPHLMRGGDGWFHLVATDMQMSQGKFSNRGIVMMRSHDLIHWEHHTVHFPKRYAGKDPAKANAVWAPQTLYDPTVGKYMVYFSLHSEKNGPYPQDMMYYAYANDDFSDLEGDPQRLFDYPYPTIDTDIVQDGEGHYHLFFNTWGGPDGLGIHQFVLDDLHRPDTWRELPGKMQPNGATAEGVSVYPLADGTWMMMYDCFKAGHYEFCRSSDLTHFELVKETTDFQPRHGSVVRITEDEYRRLVQRFGLSSPLLCPQAFPLSDVELTGGPWLRAMQLNDSVLLTYDAGRLMQPFEHEAGVAESGEPFVNWGGNKGLDGHVGGHYLSALAIGYAACRDGQTKARLKERLDWCVGRLRACQERWNGDEDVAMHGYIGGVPRSREVWTAFAQCDFGALKKSWVPFYNVHKVFAGLRDAWTYAGSEEARQMFLRLCGWCVRLIEPLDERQMEQVMAIEYGGMNEVLADAYQMTGDRKYLDAARKFSHKWLLRGMADGDSLLLDNRHANTQVPKVVGFERIWQQDRSEPYGRAADHFWREVTEQRTIAIGGNSINENFPARDDYARYVESIQGVESCNSYNMLKLSALRFADTHDSRYMDFYEGTMLNHILSTQHPQTGGYVYFTPARPQHYRVYSQVNAAMWCCVGTGMENHGRYGEFVYTHDAANDSLWVNLFVPTRLHWKARDIVVEQQTAFPYDGQSSLTILGSGRFTLLVRHPHWCQGFGVQVNGQDVSTQTAKGYAAITRQWEPGDVVMVSLPMKVTIEPLSYNSDYVAFKYGPVLLGAKTGDDGMAGIYADDSRKGHEARGERKELYSAPMLIGDRAGLAAAVKPVDLSSLSFRIDGYYNDTKFSGLTLQPFHTIHDSRYMMYWMNVTQERWTALQQELQAREDSIQALERRTVDYVNVGAQQSEADHYMEQENTRTGSFRNELYRMSDGADTHFSYQLSTGDAASLSLMLRYWSGDAGEIDVEIDGHHLARIIVDGKGKQFADKLIPIPSSLLRQKKHIRLSLRTADRCKVFCVRLCSVTSDFRQLVYGFENPQDSCRTKVWYFCGNTRMTHEGVTADMESFRKQGIGGIVYYDQVHGKADPQAQKAFSSEWWEMLKHVAHECKRVGLTFESHVSNGYVAGGPWITPDKGMQRLMVTETVVCGGQDVKVSLPKPKGPGDYAGDVAVLAVPYQEKLMADSRAVRTDGVFGERTVKIAPQGKGISTYEVVDFGKPFTARSISYNMDARGMAQTNSTNIPGPPGNRFFGTGYRIVAEAGQLEVSDDGKTWHKVCDLHPIYGDHSNWRRKTVSFPATTGRYFRLNLHDWWAPEDRNKELGLSRVVISAKAQVDGWEEKAGLYSHYIGEDTTPSYGSDEVLHPEKMVVLTNNMSADGVLRWKNAPKGLWLVMRFAHVATGGRTKHGRKEFLGLECDKLSAEAARLQWNNYCQPIIDTVRACGADIIGMHMDSHEAGSQNWTSGFERDFQRLRGYDLTEWLPVMAGYVTSSPEKSDSVLFDVRRTIADLVAERYYGTFNELCASQGLSFTAQALGNALCLVGDQIEAKGRVMKPQGEFWAQHPDGNYDIKESASAAHIYGKQIASGEAFTDADYTRSPAYIKQLCDYAYGYGLNEFVICASPHQPWLDRQPGNTCDKRAYSIGRTNTWWPYSRPLWDYQARSAFVLRQGKTVADLCVYLGDDAPMKILTYKLPDIPQGYDYDVFTTDALLARMRVSEGRIVLPDGTSYAMMVLPRDGLIGAKARKKIEELQQAGARICENKNVRQAITSSGILPDIELPVGRKFFHTHRRISDADIYFIDNHNDTFVDTTFSFRTNYQSAELWNAVTGSRIPLATEQRADGRCSVRLRMQGREAFFVVFTSQASSRRYPSDSSTRQDTLQLTSPWSVTFDKRKGGLGTIISTELTDWTQNDDPRIRYYSGTAVYRSTFKMPTIEPFARYQLSFDRLEWLASVKVNGQDMGIVWCSPWTLDITKALRPGTNDIEISVTNSLQNRLIGDASLPESERVTWSTTQIARPTDHLIPSGIIGQVRIVKTESHLSAFAKRLRPVGRILETDGYCVWGCSPIIGDDGRVHVFYSRWKASLGWGGWLKGCEIAHAVADSAEGEFRYVETVLAPRPGFFDGSTCHNPTIHKIRGKYYLYYMGTSDGNFSKKRIGYAVSKSLYGPWKRCKKPLLDVGLKGEWDDLITTNPAVVENDDRSIWLYYKSLSDSSYQIKKNGINGNRKYGVAMANHPDGPFKRYKGNPIIDFSGYGGNRQVEDAYIWHEDGLYKMLMRDMGFFNHTVGLYFESADGLHWGTPQIGYLGLRDYGIDEGPVAKNLYRYGRFERPQLLFVDGRPQYLFCATQGGRAGTSSGFVFKIE